MDSLNNHTAMVLLSTYNGEKYLAAQLASLINQTHSQWICLIRDDGSTDNTLSLIQHYCQQDPRIIFLADQLGNLRPAQSFAVLMKHACLRPENYIFFCDQDDVWLSTKLEKQIKLLTLLEQTHGINTPLLVHSDLKVVDAALNVIHPSYLQFERLSPHQRNPIQTLLINNYITGCTVGINKALLNIATPVPQQAFMHDWWCALCAAQTGKIGFVNEATILYRQHGRNTIGSAGMKGKLKELPRLNSFFTKRKRNLTICFKQAHALSSRQSTTSHYVADFAALSYISNVVQRYFSARRLKLRATSGFRACMFWMMLGFI